MGKNQKKSVLRHREGEHIVEGRKFIVLKSSSRNGNILIEGNERRERGEWGKKKRQRGWTY